MKSAGNAVISTLLMHRSYGLQGSLKRRCKHPSPTSINGYHAAKKLLSQSPAKRPTSAFAGESGYTLAFANRIAHSGLHAETGAFWTGPLLLLSERFTRFGNPAWPGVRTANFAAFGSWSEALLKDTESLRDSDALMRVAVPRRRGPAGLRDLFRFCQNCGLYALRSGPFRVCEARGGITTLSALYVLLKRRTAACQNGSFAVFLRPLCDNRPHFIFFAQKLFRNPDIEI